MIFEGNSMFFLRRQAKANQQIVAILKSSLKKSIDGFGIFDEFNIQMSIVSDYKQLIIFWYGKNQ